MSKTRTSPSLASGRDRTSPFSQFSGCPCSVHFLIPDSTSRSLVAPVPYDRVPTTLTPADGRSFRSTYQMHEQSFWKVQRILEKNLKGSKKRKGRKALNGDISASAGLTIAIQRIMHMIAEAIVVVRSVQHGVSKITSRL